RHLQSEIFRRLSTLVRLEYLTVGIPDIVAPSVSALKFQLENGFGQLASLVRMRSLCFDYDDLPELSKDEVAWMVLHWKKLESVYGVINSDPQLDTRLKNALEALGIKVDVDD
ncbi:hypothetical protein BGX31_006911, partial [Mortierella sp. GBA43]